MLVQCKYWLSKAPLDTDARTIEEAPPNELPLCHSLSAMRRPLCQHDVGRDGLTGIELEEDRLAAGLARSLPPNTSASRAPEESVVSAASSSVTTLLFMSARAERNCIALPARVELTDGLATPGGLAPSRIRDHRRSFISSEALAGHGIASRGGSETSNPPEACTRGGLVIWRQRRRRWRALKSEGETLRPCVSCMTGSV